MAVRRSSHFGFLFFVLLAITLPMMIFFSGQQQKTQQQAASVSFPDPTDYESPYGFTLRAPQSGTGGINPELISEYKTLNVHWIRDQMLWNWTETSPGVYNWTQIDQQVQLANQNGIHIVYVIQAAPPWHQITCPTDGAKYEFDVPGVTAFATALAQRYNGQSGHGFIDSFEIGNEDFDIHYAGGPPQAQVPCRNPSTYVPVLEAAYKVIKTNSPNSLVGMFGMWWESKQHEQDFLNGMYQIDPSVGKYFDYGNFHYYTATSPDTSSGPDYPTFNDRWQIMHSVFEAHGDHNKPIWCTETGWDDSNPTLQNTAMQYVFDQSRQSGVMQRVFWYTINWDVVKDIQPGDRNHPPTFAPLPSFTTYQNYVKQYPLWHSTPPPTQAGTLTPPNPTLTIPQGGTAFTITICPHGLGNCGDNVKPNSTGNTNPNHPQRIVTLTFLNAQNQPMGTTQGTVSYDSGAGNFTGTIIGNIPTGQYLIQVKTDGYLPKLAPGIITITQGQQITIPSISLVTGDINNDEQLDILDYNILVGCFGGKMNTSSCTNPPNATSPGADINDNGIVDGVDYNEFIRELSIQHGA